MLPAVGPGGVVAMRAGTVILRACHRQRTWVIVRRPPGFCDLPAAAVNLWSEWARVTSGDSYRPIRRKLRCGGTLATSTSVSLAAGRRALPMVEITREYVFTGPDG